MDNKKTIEAVIAALEQHYAEVGVNKDIEYAYGYMDAVGYLRDLASGRERLDT